ncbi:hypothetical protein JTB14_005386 [Gonioctena quinquepunctata]|nr:hypothetical protein JTB14_005386 [Gonioctena quinquepunctata]
MTARGNKVDLEHLQRNPNAIFDLDEIGSDFEIEGEENSDETYVPPELEPQNENSHESTTESEDNIPLSNFQKLHWKTGSFIQKGIQQKMSCQAPKYSLLGVILKDNLSIDEEIKKNNKLWRVQPMVDLIRNRCKAIERKAKSSFSIDEQMIPFLGRCPVRQYVKNKPRPVGLKNFVLMTSDGIILDFEICQGPTSPFEIKKYFSTVTLMEQLTSKNIYGTGTIMANRINGPEFKKDRHMKRGESEEFVRSDKKLCLTKWMDNKSVLMLSNASGVEPQSSVKRWDKIRRERVEVTCPKVVSIYNKKMGGVDLADQMIEYYRSFFKTKKWSFKVILHLFDLAVVNSCMEYRNDFSTRPWRVFDVGIEEASDCRSPHSQ